MTWNKWHFQRSELYPLSEVVDACDDRIREAVSHNRVHLTRRKVALKDDFLSGDSLVTSAVAIANRICDPLQPAILQVTTRRHDNQTGLRPTQGNV